MARGAFVKNGVVVAVADVASGLDLNYSPGVAFVPDAIAQVGDTWALGLFGYKNPDPSHLNVKLAMQQFGLNPVAVTVIYAIASGLP